MSKVNCVYENNFLQKDYCLDDVKEVGSCFQKSKITLTFAENTPRNRVVRFLQAFASTILTLGFALIHKDVRKMWEDVIWGKHFATVNFKNKDALNNYMKKNYKEIRISNHFIDLDKKSRKAHCCSGDFRDLKNLNPILYSDLITNHYELSKNSQ